jgi:hypothetical protein
MRMPGFTAAAALVPRTSPFRQAARFTPQAPNERVEPAAGPIRDCGCCILTDHYDCCRDCVEAILELL